VPLPDQMTFKISLQPGYLEGNNNNHTLQSPRCHLYLFITGIWKLLLASGCSNGEQSGSKSEKLDGLELTPLS
jgi:hypothetical protein